MGRPHFSTRRIWLAARCAFAFGAALLALTGCKGSAQPPAPPPLEVTVIEAKPSMVTVYNEYVAQTQLIRTERGAGYVFTATVETVR